MSGVAIAEPPTPKNPVNDPTAAPASTNHGHGAIPVTLRTAPRRREPERTARRHVWGEQVPDDEVARRADGMITELRAAQAAGPVTGPAIEELIDVSAVEQPDEFTHEVAIDDDLILELPRLVASLARPWPRNPGSTRSGEPTGKC